MESNSMNSLPNALPFNSATSDSTAQTGGTNVGDWKEEVYQKIKTLKDTYYADLNEMHQKISMKLHQHDSLPQHAMMEQLEKLRMFKAMLEKVMQNNILPTHREKLPSFEKQIVGLLSTNRPRLPVHPMQQEQVLPPQMQSMPQAQQPHSQISQAQSHEIPLLGVQMLVTGKNKLSKDFKNAHLSRTLVHLQIFPYKEYLILFMIGRAC